MGSVLEPSGLDAGILITGDYFCMGFYREVNVNFQGELLKYQGPYCKLGYEEHAARCHSKKKNFVNMFQWMETLDPSGPEPAAWPGVGTGAEWLWACESPGLYTLDMMAKIHSQ